MNSYILKNEEKPKEVLLYQEQTGYSFTPKKVKKITKITVLDQNFVKGILENKVTKKYNKLIQIIYSLISSDDTNSGDVLVAYTEIERIRQYLLSLQKNLDKDFVDTYLKKLYVLELELKKVHVMELEEEIEEQRGKGR